MNRKIVVCLDIKEGRVVKGVNFVDIHEVGQPIELATRYEQEGADELVLLDIAATQENRVATLNLISEVAQVLTIPFTVGGGIDSVEAAKAVIDAGADRVSVGSAAINNPQLIKNLSQTLGSERVVIAIDCKEIEGKWKVYTKGGREETQWTALEWAKEGERLGAGFVLLTSMSNDGVKSGFAIDVIKQVADAITIPVIASGGAGTYEHFLSLFQQTKAFGALAASVFHHKVIDIKELKQCLNNKRIRI